MELMREGELIDARGIFQALAHGPRSVLVMQRNHGIVTEGDHCCLLGEILTLSFIDGCQR